MVNISMDEIIEKVFCISLTLDDVSKLYLRKEMKDELTIRVCETKNPELIREFATKIEGLSKENLKMLTNAIIETESVEEQCDFIGEVEDLAEDNIDVLLKSIFSIREEEIQFQKRKTA